jgi:hypothetical protein
MHKRLSSQRITSITAAHHTESKSYLNLSVQDSCTGIYAVSSERITTCREPKLTASNFKKELFRH